jgi:ribosomal protein L12E/L44/L45/RPP1/RPP2
VIASKKTYEDSGFKIDEVLQKFEEYKLAVNKILSSPVPTQKSSEKKAEAKKEDVDMKDENNNEGGADNGGANTQ